MDTSALILYISTEVTNSSHGENKNKRDYSKKNPHTVEKVSLFLIGQDILEDYIK